MQLSNAEASLMDAYINNRSRRPIKQGRYSLGLINTTKTWWSKLDFSQLEHAAHCHPAFY